MLAVPCFAYMNSHLLSLHTCAYRTCRIFCEQSSSLASIGSDSDLQARSLDQGGLVQGQVRISAGLVQGLARDAALLLGRGKAGADEGRGRRLLCPVEAGRLHGGLTGVTELLLPARVDLVSILLEGEEGTLDLLVGLGELDDAIAQADVAVLS